LLTASAGQVALVVDQHDAEQLETIKRLGR
jgi:hypothetical protein